MNTQVSSGGIGERGDRGFRPPPHLEPKSLYYDKSIITQENTPGYINHNPRYFGVGIKLGPGSKVHLDFFPENDGALRLVVTIPDDRDEIVQLWGIPRKTAREPRIIKTGDPLNKLDTDPIGSLERVRRMRILTVLEELGKVLPNEEQATTSGVDLSPQYVVAKDILTDIFKI